MARSAATDRQFLENHSGKWRVSIAVPRDLQDTLGTRLKRSLGTDSLAIANSLKWQVVAELRGLIEQARGNGKQAHKRDPLIHEALEIARLRTRASTDEEVEALNMGTSHWIDEILGQAYRRRTEPTQRRPAAPL
jgi:uncharacterized protein DUF6538